MSEQDGSTPFASTAGLILWQEEAPATPDDSGFASSVSALLILNDEVRMSNDERSCKSRRRNCRASVSDAMAFRRNALQQSGFVIDWSLGIRTSSFDSYRTWLGAPSGGRPLRNSACCRSASRRCCASRDACSGSGPGLEQLKKTKVSTGIKNMKVTSFFIEQPQHNQADEYGNVSRSETSNSQTYITDRS